jgi:hypothetical protein
MFKKSWALLIIVLMATYAQNVNAQTANCSGELSVSVKNGLGRAVSKAKVAVYQEGVDASGVRKAIKQVGAGTVDDVVGLAKIKFTATAENANYVIKITNPSLKNRDFLFYDKVVASCGYVGRVDLTLATLRIIVQDPLINTLKNLSITVGAQGVDAANKIVSAETLGTFNSGELGVVDVLTPGLKQSATPDSYFYIVGAKNSKGLTFYQDTIVPVDDNIKYVTIKISDAVIMVKDRAGALAMPNVKISVLARNNSGFGGYEAGKVLETLTTDSKGRAYVQLPAGDYYLSYQNANGEKINTPLTIESAKRQDVTLWVDNYQAAKCQYKSEVNLAFKNYQQQLIAGASYNIYSQTFDANGWPAIDDKLTSGKSDAYGVASAKLNNASGQKYLLEVCGAGVKGACFWFSNISFECSTKVGLEKILPATNIVLRDTVNKLLVGQKFKIYQKTLDIDGKAVVDPKALIGSYSLPASGRLSLQLPSKDLQGREVAYVLVVDRGTQLTSQTEFVALEVDQTLNYQVSGAGLKLIKETVSEQKPSVSVVSGSNRLAGRILLQVEDHGEAWYIDPVSSLRYYLAGPPEAFALMRQMAIGIANSDLNKIPVAVMKMSGMDSDRDGLVDRLETAIGTNPQLADMDGDGYNDYQELAGGFNAMGSGRMSSDQRFTNKYLGRILLQVEGRGEAWYLNPVDAKRYYLGLPEDAYQVMRNLGLGATNADLEKIVVGN